MRILSRIVKEKGGYYLNGKTYAEFLDARRQLSEYAKRMRQQQKEEKKNGKL